MAEYDKAVIADHADNGTMGIKMLAQDIAQHALLSEIDGTADITQIT
ncbi:hypothetical protein ABEG75_23320 [Pantoea agglomerans]|nr:hypothetical protein [Pantoea agglomerans]